MKNGQITALTFGEIDDDGNIGGLHNEIIQSGVAYAPTNKIKDYAKFGWALVRHDADGLSVVERGISRLTVGALRAAIAELPDDMTVCISSHGGGDAEGAVVETCGDGTVYLLIS